ncbi:hypothetical protein GE21DRAFT_1351219, partial [Neurospora crassa]
THLFPFCPSTSRLPPTQVFLRRYHHQPTARREEEATSKSSHAIILLSPPVILPLAAFKLLAEVSPVTSIYSLHGRGNLSHVLGLDSEVAQVEAQTRLPFTHAPSFSPCRRAKSFLVMPLVQQKMVLLFSSKLFLFFFFFFFFFLVTFWVLRSLFSFPRPNRLSAILKSNEKR